ncbi:MAG: hypothetical protein WCC87_23170, partial [Candidatus Korobacteraceae bacterium]
MRGFLLPTKCAGLIEVENRSLRGMTSIEFSLAAAMTNPGIIATARPVAEAIASSPQSHYRQGCGRSACLLDR